MSIKKLPPHESGVRRLVSDAKNEPYCALMSLSEAKKQNDGVVIFEGDDGGQIYLVACASHVNCSETELAKLLKAIDNFHWKDSSAARVFYERHPIGAGVEGGMGGGKVIDGIWIHPKLRVPEIVITEILAGRGTSDILEAIGNITD